MAAPRVILLICGWLCVQWLVCFVPVRTFRNAYVSCQHDPSCRGHDVAREWDTRRTYAAILWSQFAQPVGSALLLSLTRTSRSRRRHLFKAVAFGLLGGALGLVTVAAWDVWLGGRLGVRLTPATTRKLVAGILFVVGALTAIYALAPSALPTP